MGRTVDDVTRYKYDPIPEDGPRHRKRPKREHVRSDHRHEYEDVCIDAQTFVRGLPRYYIGRRCVICGRLQDTSRTVADIPEGMRVFVVDGFLGLLAKKLPDDMEVF